MTLVALSPQGRALVFSFARLRSRLLFAISTARGVGQDDDEGSQSYYQIIQAYLDRASTTTLTLYSGEPARRDISQNLNSL